MSAWWLFGRPYFFVPQFCGPCKNGHEFGLMADGDEICLSVGECGGRIHLNSVLAD